MNPPAVADAIAVVSTKVKAERQAEDERAHATTRGDGATGSRRVLRHWGTLVGACRATCWGWLYGRGNGHIKLVSPMWQRVL